MIILTIIYMYFYDFSIQRFGNVDLGWMDARGEKHVYSIIRLHNLSHKTILCSKQISFLSVCSEHI